MGTRSQRLRLANRRDRIHAQRIIVVIVVPAVAAFRWRALFMAFVFLARYATRVLAVRV